MGRDTIQRVTRGCLIASLVALPVLMSACGKSGSHKVAPSPLAGAFDQQVKVASGRRVHVECNGAGAPVVVLESALGADSTVWSGVVPDVARTTRVCAYDRAGLGSSDPVGTHTLADSAADLAAWVDAVLPAKQVVLVGWSAGGDIVRLYAGSHPDRVAGMVLVETTGEGFFSRALAVLPSNLKKSFLEPSSEKIDFPAALDAMRSAPPAKLGAKPLVVISRGINPYSSVLHYPAAVAADLERIWQDEQSKLLTISTRSRQVIAHQAHHNVPAMQPAIIVDAIASVLAEVKPR
jgi:pimeloyl-ACP methyl ester carboxylesterase